MFRGWVTLLVVSLFSMALLGWNTFPSIMHRSAFSGSQVPEAALRSISSQPASGSSVERGHDLFMGSLHFQNGGPPCMGCHNIGSNGILGGGALGPDLTDVFTKRSPSELQSILSNSERANVPVMRPIYAEHPLTEAERADLLAFINASVGQPEANREWWVIGISLVGFIAAIGLIELVYHRRLRGVRKPMVMQANSKR